MPGLLLYVYAEGSVFFLLFRNFLSWLYCGLHRRFAHPNSRELLPSTLTKDSLTQ
jgi:hypothetical protein